MAVVVGQEAYGVDVRIVDSFSGALQHDEVIRVWGDCGALCRRYVSGSAIGDTVLWALQPTDFSGNVICGTQLEAEGEYQLSVCGVYALAYSNGMVSGPLTTETTEVMDREEFAALVTGCLATGLEELSGRDQLVVSQGPAGTTLSLATPSTVNLSIVDAAGRVCVSRSWNGAPYRMDQLPMGMYSVAVLTKQDRFVRKVLVQ